MDNWKARERVCGRIIVVQRRDDGTVILPAICPECGISPVCVDLVERQRDSATQAAQDLAAENGIALELVNGSGSHGLITKADVLAAIAARGAVESEGGASSGESAEGGEA
jgi:pyruvate/2-oxoglutarate dehydrogenase complex dihydrolipoamide acyltransferase (E2) component